MKDKEKGTVPSKYRPVTCLSTFFELMTAIIVELLKNHLQNNGNNVLTSDEQKGNHRKSSKTKEKF